MIKVDISVKEVKTFIKDLLNLPKTSVYVGIPEQKDPRKEGREIGNAALAYIHDNGSPLRNIPARPFMQPGIKAVQDKINIHLKNAAKAVVDGKNDKVIVYLNRAGIVAASSIKNVINEGEGFAPLKRSTLLGRLRKRKAAKKWASKKREETMASMHPLVDTASMRNSISYFVE